MGCDDHIHVQLECGAIARVSPDISEKELIVLNNIVQKLMNMTVGEIKKGKLF